MGGLEFCYQDTRTASLTPRNCGLACSDGVLLLPCITSDKMCFILKEILFLTIFDSNINATSVNTMINMDYNHQRSQSEVSLYYEHRPNKKVQSYATTKQLQQQSRY